MRFGVPFGLLRRAELPGERLGPFVNLGIAMDQFFAVDDSDVVQREHCAVNDMVCLGLIDLFIHGTVADFLEDQGLQVKKLGGGAARIGCLGIGLSLVLQRRLQKVHLGREKALVRGGKLAVRKALHSRRESPHGVLLLRLSKLAKRGKPVRLGLHGLEVPQQILYVQGAGAGAEIFEGTFGAAGNACLAALDLGGFRKSSIRNAGRFYFVQPYGRSLAQLYLVLAVNAGGFGDASGSKVLLDRRVPLNAAYKRECQGHASALP